MVTGYWRRRRARHHLWVTDELPVKLCIKWLHMQAVDVQHWITNNTDLFEKKKSYNIFSLSYSMSMEHTEMWSQHLLQLLHVQRLIQIQTSVLVFIGTGVDEPLQEPLQVEEPECDSKNAAVHAVENLWMTDMEVLIPGTSPCRCQRWHQCPRSPASDWSLCRWQPLHQHPAARIQQKCQLLKQELVFVN